MTATEGLPVPPGHGRVVRTPAQRVRFKVPGTQPTPGTVVVVPPGCPHAFADPTDAPARMFFQASPPPDHAAVEELRRRYDIGQPTPPRHRQRIGIPARVRAMTRRWISLVPSKMV